MNELLPVRYITVLINQWDVFFINKHKTGLATDSEDHIQWENQSSLNGRTMLCFLLSFWKDNIQKDPFFELMYLTELILLQEFIDLIEIICHETFELASISIFRVHKQLSPLFIKRAIYIVSSHKPDFTLRRQKY